jgi:hypothetical protein
LDWKRDGEFVEQRDCDDVVDVVKTEKIRSAFEKSCQIEKFFIGKNQGAIVTWCGLPLPDQAGTPKRQPSGCVDAS